MVEVSKKTRQELRKLKAKAYSNELDKYLHDLSTKFDDWKNKKIDCGDLTDHIHKFHDGISRDLFNSYNSRGVDDLYMISRGLALGYLRREEIPEEVIEKVEYLAISFFENES